ncbi:MAG TPA: serine hydrolase domain-containing protein [Anaerolineales bacterium]|nr:serine hydrolase domain-containing protein [Anaerolineales bacterium]
MNAKYGRFTEALDASIDAHAFSGVVSIRQHGRILYERATGYADRSNKIANTLETRFGIASGTKFLTALAIGKLIAEGKLSLSTTLQDCLVLDFPQQYVPGITIQHLLTHTSGIPDFYDEEKITDFDNFFVGRPWYEMRGPRDYLTVFPDEPMKFAPGARFSYSNGGYILLGVVIEQVTGRPYQDYVDQAIFRALGMKRSGFFAFNRLPEGTAFGYIGGADGWRTNIYNLPIVGASDGGAYTTVDDLATLWKAFWANEIVPQNLGALFASPYMKADGEGEATYYGHGLWLNLERAEHPEVYIVGSDAGVSFWSSVRLDSDRLVTVISNTSNGAWPLLRDIRSTLKALDEPVA